MLCFSYKADSKAKQKRAREAVSYNLVNSIGTPTPQSLQFHHHENLFLTKLQAESKAKAFTITISPSRKPAAMLPVMNIA